MAITSIPTALRTSKRDAAFWRRIDVGDRDDCWLWLLDRQVSQRGYGTAFYGSIHTTAHRIAYMLARGPIPEGLELLHSCDNRRCCNPWHVQPGTSQDNTDDMEAKDRDNYYVLGSRDGERNGNAKLRNDDVPRIHELATNGLSQRKIAAELGISKSQVGNILRGDSRTTTAEPK
jgi:predicted XRE-type DNA-binding protein